MLKLNVDHLERFVKALGEVVKDYGCDMMQTRIYPPEENVCGTPGCHAGWAFLALHKLGFFQAAKMKPGVPIEGYDFRSGAIQLSEYLIDDKDVYACDIADWAHLNPKLWGNLSGSAMFSAWEAFGQPSNLFPASILYEHWKEVLERVKKAYAEEQSVS